MSETLIGLVEHYSPSGQERAAAEWLVGRMQALGYTDASIDAAGNAVGISGSGARQVVLLGHIDTVPGEIPVRVENGVLHGRGTVDAKGALACFVDAAAQVGPVEGWQLVVIGAVEEERSSEGARHAARQYQPDLAVIGEPNHWDRIALGYKGSAWAEVTVRLPQAHTAGNQPSAAEAAVEVWQAIRAYAQAFNAEKPKAFEQILPSLRGVQSEEDGFEQRARLTIGARLPPEITPEQWYARLDALAARAEVTRLGYPIPAWACQKNSSVVRAFLKGIRGQGGQPSFVYKTGTADLNIVAPAWGCPALVYGPGDSALDHTPQEQLSLAEYARATEVLVTALGHLTQSP